MECEFIEYSITNDSQRIDVRWNTTLEELCKFKVTVTQNASVVVRSLALHFALCLISFKFFHCLRSHRMPLFSLRARCGHTAHRFPFNRPTLLCSPIRSLVWQPTFRFRRQTHRCHRIVSFPVVDLLAYSQRLSIVTAITPAQSSSPGQHPLIPHRFRFALPPILLFSLHRICHFLS
jgi:hypothetical protein